jgi:hypothetical protein
MRYGTDRIGGGHGKSNKINEMEAQTRYRLWFREALDTSAWFAEGRKKGRRAAPFIHRAGGLQDE